ncbi:methyltransferase domain-containing protein [Candidatus Pacearchaeota archaeon]|nr:methyltransferase domain-containing protein [Candidatus Pacearchaeota archaeon]
MKCRICDNGKLDLILSLGHQPPSDAFLTEEDLQSHETYYPLDLYHCDRCGLAQLGYVVAKEVLFNDEYPYQTGQNEGGRKHFKGLADSVVSKYGLKHDDLVVDIGGNDGTLLGYFKEHGCAVVNVEPCKSVADLSKDKGIMTRQEFWDYKVALGIKYRMSLAKVIVGTNVLAHVDDIHGFMNGVDVLLAEDGAFIVEAPALSSLISFGEWDTIYHEHLSYLDYDSMKYLMGRYHMHIMDLEQLDDIHGGTYRYSIKRLPAASRPEQKKAA